MPSTYEMVSLSDTELKLLQAMLATGKRVVTMEELHRVSGLPLPTLHAAAQLLKEKGIIELKEEVEERYETTDEGKRVVKEGFPEEKLAKLLEEMGGVASLEELSKRLPRDELSIALGWCRKRGWVEVRGRVVVLKRYSDLKRERSLLSMLERGGRVGKDEQVTVMELARRRLLRPVRVKVVRVVVKRDIEQILQKATVEISRLSREVIVSGAWRRFKLKRYDVTAEPPRIYPGRRHFYVEFLNHIRRVLKEMGFIEVEGPVVELEFWNFDILFQAQDHPAREIHDTFWLKTPSEGRLPHKDLVKRVASVHETGGSTGSTGWGYKWDPRIAKRLVLRTQTTSVSARVISAKPGSPLRAFTIGKVFRPDVIDARHLPEFVQLDGIVMENGMNFRMLLGIIKEFFERIGIERVRFKPGYFPFTEPSVEGYIYVPGRGWVECFGAGMFRPEVLEMVGAELPVGAWGFGVDRIAMSILEIPDIRLLYTRDLSFLRSFPAWW